MTYPRELATHVKIAFIRSNTNDPIAQLTAMEF